MNTIMVTINRLEFEILNILLKYYNDNIIQSLSWFFFQQMVFLILPLLQHSNLSQTLPLFNFSQICLYLTLVFSWPMYWVSLFILNVF